MDASPDTSQEQAKLDKDSPPIDASPDTSQEQVKQGGKKKREWKKATNLADFYAPPSYAASKSRNGGKGGKGFDSDGRGRGGGKGAGKGYVAEASRGPVSEPPDHEALPSPMAASPGGNPGASPTFDTGMDGCGSFKGAGKRTADWKPSGGGGKRRDGKGKGGGKPFEDRKGGKGPGMVMVTPTVDQAGLLLEPALLGGEEPRAPGRQQQQQQQRQLRMPGGVPGSPNGGPAVAPIIPVAMGMPGMPGMPMCVPGALPGGGMPCPMAQGAVYMPSCFVAAVPPAGLLGNGSPLTQPAGCVPAFAPLSSGAALYLPGAQLPGSPTGVPRPQMMFGAGVKTWQSAGEVKEKVRLQVEYYFGDENLNKDMWLRQTMTDEGWVPVEVISNFNKIKEKTSDMSVIVEAIAASESLELDQASSNVRRREDWHAWPLKTGQS